MMVKFTTCNYYKSTDERESAHVIYCKPEEIEEKVQKEYNGRIIDVRKLD